MGDIIKQLGLVESINDTHLCVKIVQTSACGACDARGHCLSTDCKEQWIDIYDSSAFSYSVGEQVWVIGESKIGHLAVVYAFLLPFILLIGTLFLSMSCFKSELLASLVSLSMLIPYYFILYLNKKRLKQKLSFSVIKK